MATKKAPKKDIMVIISFLHRGSFHDDTIDSTFMTDTKTWEKIGHLFVEMMELIKSGKYYWYSDMSFDEESGFYRYKFLKEISQENPDFWNLDFERFLLNCFGAGRSFAVDTIISVEVYKVKELYTANLMV